MMSNPKIPSQTVFVLSHSRATSFPRCLPSFTLTGTACLAAWRQWDWRGLTSTPLTESQCQEEQQKRRGCCRDLWPSFSPHQPLHVPAFMLIVSAAGEHNERHAVKKNRWHNLSLSLSQTLSLTPVVKRSSVPDKDWWLNRRRRPAQQIYRMEGVQPWLAAVTPHRGNDTKHTKRCPTNLNCTFFPFDSFHNKSERNTGKIWKNGTHADKKGERVFVLRHAELLRCNMGLILAPPDTLMST